MNTTDTEPRDAYVIVCGELYWSNDLGWTGLTEADWFSQEERDRFSLPVGGSWMPLEIADANRAETAEKERDEARAEAKAQSGLKLEYMAQAEAAEARLAQARADVLEEAAHLIETDFGWQLPMFDDRRLNDVTDDVACAVQEQIVCFVRALANNSEPAAEESRKE